MTGGPIKATGHDTLGAYAIVEFAAAPGDPGPPLHIHHRTVECFYVIEGALTITRNGEPVTATAGCMVAVLPRVAHTFVVAGATPARFLVIVSPPAFIRFFEEMLGLATGPTPEPHDIEVLDGGQADD